MATYAERLNQQAAAQKAGNVFSEPPVRASVAAPVPEPDNQSVLRNAGQDVSSIAKAIPAIVTSLTHPIKLFADFFGIQRKGAGRESAGEVAGGQMLEDERGFGQRAADLLTMNIGHDIQDFWKSGGVEFNPMESGLVQSVKDMADMKLAKEHPVIYAMNALGNVSGAAGVLKGSVMVGIKQEAVGTLKKEALAAGIKESAVDAMLKDATVKRAFSQSVRSGSSGFITDVWGNVLAKLAGIDESVARVATARAGQSVVDSMATVAKRLSVYDAFEHPLRSGFGAIADSPATKMIFGSPEKTAVAMMFGTDTVKKDPDGFLAIERWAEAQTKERGIKNTPDNRYSMMREWERENSYAKMSPEERVQDFRHYITVTEKARRAAKITGMKIVPVRTLDANTVEAMKETVMAMSPAIEDRHVYQVLRDTFGKDFERNETEVKRLTGLLRERDAKDAAEALIKESESRGVKLSVDDAARIISGKSAKPWRDSLVEAIDSLTQGTNTINFGKLRNQGQATLPGTDPLMELVKSIEKTGYRFGPAPRNKRVTMADAIAAGKGSSDVLESDLMSPGGSPIGQFLDFLGLSAHGIPRGAEEHIFQQSFTQHALTDFKERLGNRLRLSHPSFNISVPVTGLYDWLDRNIAKIESLQGRGGLGEKFRSVYDIKASHLENVGFSKKQAKAVEELILKSRSDIPASVVGAGDWLLNHVRKTVPAFDRWINVAANIHFNYSPTFAAQDFLEATATSGLILKDPGLIVRQLAGTIPVVRTLFKDAIKRPTLNEVAVVQKEILSAMPNTMAEFLGSPTTTIEAIDSARRVGIRGAAKTETDIVSKNFWLRAFGQSATRMATDFNKSIAAKFGMTLERAVRSPDILRLMRETTEELFHYKPGVLTSSLMKTLNSVWFPLRFQAKTMQLTGKWVSGLSPLARMAVVSDWSHFTNFLTTDEGLSWQRENRNRVMRFIQYVTAHEQVGATLDSVLKGELFGGRTGKIGGMPLGWLTETLRQMEILPSSEGDFNLETGGQFERKVLSNPMSSEAAQAFLVNLLMVAMPSVALSGISGGEYRGNILDAVRDIKGMVETKAKEQE